MTPEQQRDAVRREDEGRAARSLVEAACESRRSRGLMLAYVNGAIVEVPRPADDGVFLVGSAGVWWGL